MVISISRSMGVQHLPSHFLPTRKKISPMEKKKIMVVEDERIVARDLTRQLTELGYDVVAMAYSGEEAVEKAGEVQPDLVLMDIVLAGKLDGTEACAKIMAFADV